MLYIPSVDFKHCTKCHIEFPATRRHFYKDKHQSSGLRAICKVCARHDSFKRNENCREANCQRAREYYRTHREKHRAYMRQWNEEHRAEEKARKLRWYYSHLEQASARRRLRYETHREQIKKEVRQWKQDHPELTKTFDHNRRARKLNAPGSHNANDILAQLKRQKNRCYYCGGKLVDKYHVDHIVPLSRGGSDDPENLVATCPRCNLSKGDKLPSEWAEGGRLL